MFFFIIKFVKYLLVIIQVYKNLTTNEFGPRGLKGEVRFI